MEKEIDLGSPAFDYGSDPCRFPFLLQRFFTTESVPMGIFIFLVFEATAISMCIVGIVKIRDALKIRHQIREKTDKDRESKN